MFHTDPSVAALSKFVSLGGRFDHGFVVHKLTLPRILKAATPEEGAQFAEALLTVLPPWEGEQILLPLERLGFSFAFGTVMLTYPSGDESEDRECFARFACRLAEMVDAALIQREAFGHRVFVQIFLDRVAAWMMCVRAIRDLCHRSLSNQLAGVLVERLVAIASYKASLLDRVLHAQLTRESAAARRALGGRIECTFSCGMAHPWQPVLNDDDREKGIDILLESALPTADCRSLFALLRRVVSREVIVEPNLPPNFVAGLIRNSAFKQSGTRLPGML